MHWPGQENQHSNLGQSNSLLIMCILPLQPGQFVYFWVDDIPPLIVYLPRTDKYILHSCPTWLKQKLGKARWKWRIAKCMVSSARGKVTWCQRCMEVQTSQSKHGTLFMGLCSHSQESDASKCFGSVFGLATDVPSVSMKLQEASWRCHKVIWRTCCREVFQILCDYNLAQGPAVLPV